MGGYAANQGPLFLLTGGANTLAVDTSHQVTFNNTIPSFLLAKDYTAPPSAGTIATATAAAILATPGNLIATDKAGAVNVSGLTPGNLDGKISDLQTHGDANWKTATGFAVPGSAMTLTGAYDRAKTAATPAEVTVVVPR